ncbi:MAG: FAS1-like dehydratase domain-containing protein [Acidimicrobiales bacterium]
MVSRDEVVGRSTGKAVLRVERGPVTTFAEAVTESSPIYQRADAAQAAGFDDIPVPPTWFFSAASHWGAFPEQQPADAEPERNPTMEVIGALRAKGGMILHGEQEFTYHRPVVVGQTVRSEGEVVDLYEKASGDRTMTFFVTETKYFDESGELAVTARMNLIHRS